ncbi:glycerophosphoryl diester phosphodiesterase membrane domain-containing protein [Xylanimonas sp. McL0601]|uniref:glycerophosphoryl diester phosphodiesterase membrane domain-containing protein n=1 Tax=Xylanimonas sp. McL0601 TaxID=3414739 RepID=UPI003CE8D81B
MSTPQQPDDVTPAPPEPAAPVPPPSGWGDVPRYGQYGAAPTPPPTPYGTPYGQTPYRPAADKPGIVPLRPLTLGEIYDGAFSAVRHNPAVMLGLATLVILAATVIGVLVGQLLVPGITRLVGPIFDDPALRDSGLTIGFTAGGLAQLYASSAGAGLTFLLSGPIVNGLLTVSVSRSVLGDKATVRQVWDRVGPRVWVLIGWSLLQTVALLVVVGAFVALAVGLIYAVSQASGLAAGLIGVLLVLAAVAAAVWLSTRLLLVPPALALEKAGLWATVRRAWVLTRGSFWRVFGIYLLASFIVGVIAQVIAVPLSLVGGIATVAGGSATASVLVTSIVTTVLGSAVSTIFLAGVVALLYVDLRMRREGLDVALAAAAAERRG